MSSVRRTGSSARDEAARERGREHGDARLPGRWGLRGRQGSAVAATFLDLGLLTGFWLLFFWAILVRRDHLIPYDLIDQHYMFQDFLHQALRGGGGGAPWWTPHILGGYPIVADPLAALFYPPNALMHLFARDLHLPYLYLELQLALHYLWAATGTYFLARSLTGSRAGGLLAGLTFAFGSFFAMHVPHLSPISGLSWLPWILLALRLALTRPSWFWTGLAAAAFALMALAGHALTILQAGYLLVAITAIVVWRRWGSARGAAIRAGLTGLIVLGLGAALAMVQLLPSWQLSAQTERAELSYGAATAASYAPHWLVTLLLPNFFAPDGPAAYWGSGDPAETNLYVGLLPLALAALGIARARGDDRRMTGWLLAGGLLALVLAFGSHAWIYRIAFDLLPGVDRVRRPTNFIAFVQLALGLLAAFGLKSLLTPRPDGGDSDGTLRRWLRRALLVDLALLGLAALALALAVGSPAQPVLIAVINGLVLAGVVLLASEAALRGRLGGQLSPGRLAALLLVIAALDLGTAMAGKVYQHHERAPDSYIGADWAGNPDDQTVRRLLEAQRQALPDRFRLYPRGAGSIWENGPLVWGLESAWGYSVLWPNEYRAFAEAAVADPNSPLFDRLNIRYLLTAEPLEKVYPGIRPGKFRVPYPELPRLYENTEVRPRVWVAHQAVVQPDDAVLAYLRAAGQGQATGSGGQGVVVLSAPGPSTGPSNPAQPGSAEIVQYDNTRVVIRASLPAPGFVVLADTYYPGWRAEVDGAVAEIYRADLAFRAVWVPAGEHQITFRFSQPGLRAGALISTAAATLLLALLAVGRVAWRRASRPAAGDRRQA